jgi:putative ABC transport system permease protein
MKTFLKMSFRNVILNWRHSLASLLSIAAAFFALNLFQGYISDLADLYEVSYRERSMLGDLMIEHQEARSPKANANPWDYSLNLEIQNAIQKFINARSDKILTSVRFLNGHGMITNGQSSTIFAIQGFDVPEGKIIRGSKWAWNTQYGEPLDHYDGQGYTVVAKGLGQILNCHPRDGVSAFVNSDGSYKPEKRPFDCKNSSLQLTATTDSGQVNAIDLEVVGLMDGGFAELDKKLLGASLTDVQALLDTNRISTQTIMLKKTKDLSQVVSEFNQEVRTVYPQLKIQRWQDNPYVGELYVRSMELLGIFRNFVTVVIIVISSLSVLNMMTKSLNERVKEIGTLLSLGFLKSHIKSIFVFEAVFLSLFGVLFGASICILSATIINHSAIFYKGGLLVEPVPLRIKLDYSMLAMSTFFLVAVSVVTTSLACGKVLKKKIVECLNHTS